MSSNQKNRKNKKKLKFFRYFIVSFALLSAVVVGAYAFSTREITTKENEVKGETVDKSQDKGTLLDTLFGSKQIKTNIAVFGVDGDGTRTDVMFVATFDSKTKKIGLLSIPRDTRVTMTDPMITEIKGLNKYVPYKGITKINAVHAYAPKDKRSEFAVMQLENLLSIAIDNYIEIDFEGFRNIVDAFGGVDIDVPQNMDYEDPYQNLYIHLDKGMQNLDGAEAEQLVRFRSYPEGDVTRVQVQQLFLKELARKILNTQNILSNLGEITKTLFKDVKTDIGIDDALKYMKYIKEISVDNITMKTLPGVGEYVGGVSYYLHDAVETRTVVDELFYNTEEAQSSKALEEKISSKDKKIEVLNGGSVGGIASRTKDKLVKAGFNVTSIGTYEGERKKQTVILVNQEGLGYDLQQYFSSSIVTVDSNKVSQGYDITIVIGTGEK